MAAGVDVVEGVEDGVEAGEEGEAEAGVVFDVAVVGDVEADSGGVGSGEGRSLGVGRHVTGSLARDSTLRLPHVVLPEEELPVEVRDVDGVEVDDLDVLETGEGEVLEKLATYSAGAYYEDF